MRLESVLDVAPNLQEWYEQNITVLVVDHEKVLKTYIHPELDIGVREGESMEKYSQSGAYRALKTSKRIMAKVNDKTRFKIPYVTIANPIIDNGETVGAISVVISTEEYDRLVTYGEELLAALQEIFATAESLSAHSEELSATAKSMDDETIHVKADLADVAQITDEIKKLSAQSNILGINASIESARAGVHGHGFAVVANEVRKLADNTKISAHNIEEDVNRVQKSVEMLVESVSQLATVSETQAAGIVELTQTLNQISQMAQQLVDMGRKIS